MSENFSLDLIYDLHCIVGTDMVTEFYNELSEEDKPEYIKALKEYYDTKYWKKYERDDD